jgi:hypothetical protein
LDANSFVDEVKTGLDLRGDWWWSWKMLRRKKKNENDKFIQIGFDMIKLPRLEL